MDSGAQAFKVQRRRQPKKAGQIKERNYVQSSLAIP